MFYILVYLNTIHSSSIDWASEVSPHSIHVDQNINVYWVSEASPYIVQFNQDFTYMLYMHVFIYCPKKYVDPHTNQI